MTELDPSVRGSQPAGPNRWARAAQWAEAKPDSSQARKYRTRVETAETVAAITIGHGLHGWLHYRHTWKSLGTPEYRGQTCSTKCAILQIQVDLGVDGLAALDKKLHDEVKHPDHFIMERPADCSRKGKCLVCGGKVT